jgi:hypothetical protein
MERSTTDAGNMMMRKTDIYAIRVKGVLDSDWSDWFDGLTVTPSPNGETLITGPIQDQAALYGVLIRVHDLGLELISAVRLE